MLESQYWKCSFPLLRDRFRSGLVYIILTCILWMIYLCVFGQDRIHQWVGELAVSVFCTRWTTADSGASRHTHGNVRRDVVVYDVQSALPTVLLADVVPLHVPNMPSDTTRLLQL